MSPMFRCIIDIGDDINIFADYELPNVITTSTEQLSYEQTPTDVGMTDVLQRLCTDYINGQETSNTTHLHHETEKTNQREDKSLSMHHAGRKKFLECPS